MPIRPLREQTRGPAFGAVAAIAAVLPSLSWIWLDRRIFPWDQAWYGEVATDLYAIMRLQPSAWFGAMETLLPAKPPLVSWLGQLFVPLGIRLGDIDFALLLTSVLSQAGTLWFVWLCARRIAPESIWSAVATLLMVGSAPLFVGMSHQFVTEPMQTTIVAASFYLALVSTELGLARVLVLLALLGTAGFAVKTTTLAYCGGAWAIVAWAALMRWRRGEHILGGSGSGWTDVALAVGSACLMLLTAIWYVTNVGGLIGHVVGATMSEAAEFYGHKGTLPAKLMFWIGSGNSAFFLAPRIFPALLVLLCLVAVLRLWRMRSLVPDRPAASQQDAATRSLTALVAVTALGHVIAVLLLLSAQINEETRFVVALLPPLALSAVWTVRQMRGLCFALPLAVLLLAQWLTVHMEAHGRIARVSGSAWLLPVRTGITERETADAIAGATCSRELAQRYVVIGVEAPSMNANSVAFHSAKLRLARGYRCYYTSLGYAEKDAQKALDRIDQLRATFIVLPRRERLPVADVLNSVVAKVFETVSRSNRYSRAGSDIGDYQVYRRAD